MYTTGLVGYHLETASASEYWLDLYGDVFPGVLGRRREEGNKEVEKERK
jgi:hypothetical protein